MTRKNYKRSFNRTVRQFNKNLKEDNLWQGRFYLSQLSSSWFAYEDHSGGQYIVLVRITDRKTNRYEDKYFSVCSLKHFNDCDMFKFANDFIIEEVK